MGKKEPNLIKQTSVEPTDMVRIVSQGGTASRLISVENLASDLAPLLETTDNFNTVRIESSNTILLETDEYLEMDASGGDLALLLMNPSDVFDATNSIGQRFYVKFIFDGNANKVSTTSSGGAKIDNDTQVDVYGPDDLALGFQSIGTAWRIVQ